MIVWLPPSHQHLFLLALISWTLFCMELRLSTQLVFNVSSMQRLGLSCTSILVHLHCLQMNFSNSSTGFLLNGVYGSTMTFKALHTHRPPYLSDVLQHHEPTRSLHSSSSHQLLVPRHKLTFESRAFRFSAPRVWNSLPVSIRETNSLRTFRRHLKTFYFQSAHPLSAAHFVWNIFVSVPWFF